MELTYFFRTVRVQICRDFSQQKAAFIVYRDAKIVGFKNLYIKAEAQK